MYFWLHKANIALNELKMKILLVGEYSRLHNSLKEGLLVLGHQVTLVSTGDDFKSYPSDILLKRKFDSGISKKVKIGLFKLFGIDITSISLKNQFFQNKEKFQDFDIVQYINESPLGILPKYEKQIISFLSEKNKKLYLLSCGTDYTSVKYTVDKKFRYSIFTPFFEGKISKKDFFPALKYLNPEYKGLHDFIFEKVDGIITSDLDYHIPLQGHKKYLGLIPNPVNTDKLQYSSLSTEGKIIIFHGINRANYFKKGNDYFEMALEQTQKKFPSKVEIISVENIPYSEYIEKYNSAHIILDQVFAYDQGYNALEAMAKGKVVFTGAETEFLEYYDLTEKVAINALPDSEKIAAELENLILNPDKIERIGKNARSFIEREHDYIDVARLYIQTWK